MISAYESGYLCILHWDTTREAMMGAAVYLIHSLLILPPFSYLSIVQASITRYAQDTYTYTEHGWFQPDLPKVKE